jgi:cytochrome c2
LTRRFLPILLAAAAVAGPATAAGDAKHGAVVFAQCAACHSLDEGKAMLGPNLKAIVGRKAGADEAYVYSPAMRRSAIVWTPENLDAYLQDSQATVRGTKMPFEGLTEAKDRADVIAYLTAPTAK